MEKSATYRKRLILDLIDDLVIDFVAYDRRNSDTLPEGEIEEAIESGEITFEEMANRFKERLIAELGLEDE